ncbi:MAG: phosphonate ABC transporter substrate-binding protein, partial [Rhodospirillales bacterium]
MMKNLLLGFVALVLVACGQHEGDKTAGPQFAAQAPVASREYVFAIHPLHNPVRLFEIYQPVIDHLNRNIPGSTFKLEASRNYEEFDKKLYTRQFDFALPNP